MQNQKSTLAAGWAVFLLLAIGLTCNFAEPDFWSFLNFGRQFWMEGGLPRRDVFSYLPTINPLMIHEWLTWVLFYPVYSQSGPMPLQLLKYASGLLAAWLAFNAARNRGASSMGALAGLFLASYVWAYGFPSVLARNFSSLFFVATIALVEARKSGRHRAAIWWLVPLFALWANLHGGFFTGLAVLGIYAAGETRPRRPAWLLLGVMAASAAATLANPYGWKLWSTVLAHGASPDPDIWEWMSIPRSILVLGWKPESVLFVMLAVAALPLVLFYGRRDRTSWMMLAFFGYLAYSAHRHIPFFVMAFAVYAPEGLTAWFSRIRDRPRSGLARAAILITAAACLVPAVYDLTYYAARIRVIREPGSPLELVAPDWDARANFSFAYPRGAVRFIRENGLEGKILSELVWGGYLAWELYPQCLIAYDTRTETTFPPQVRRMYYDFFFGRPGWQDILYAGPPDMVVINARGPLRRAMDAHPGWREAYSDPACVLFVPVRFPGGSLKDRQ
ncbi:MAG: hypothetical protein KKA60_08070 [Proteobacteria bacterium]|nr:hypothetical protein [Pseudomonadota bacterium]